MSSGLPQITTDYITARGAYHRLPQIILYHRLYYWLYYCTRLL